MTNPVITIFGGTGFLGHTIVRHLTESEMTIRIAARHPPTSDFATGNIEYRTADVRDEATVAEAVQGASGVVNAVALYVEQKEITFDAIHVQGAERVARQAREAGVQSLVHISGIGADPTSPSKYVRARAHGEQRVHDVFPNAVIVRPSVLFGPEDAFLSSMKAVTRLPVVPLFGRGDTRLQPVYVEDIARAVRQILITPETAGKIFELGGARIYTYREIVEKVLAHLGRRRWLLPIPFAVWKSLATLASALPTPPLTSDQVILMETDNVVNPAHSTFEDLTIEPRSLEQLLTQCLGTDS